MGKKKKITILFIVSILLIASGVLVNYFNFFGEKSKKISTENTSKYSPYRLSGNSLESFDLYFLQLENTEKNKIYSPLSIKYALQMLSEGASGDTKKQIDSILGKYNSKKYVSSDTMSFANAMFINNKQKESIKSDYITNLSNKYNAEVIYDDFSTPNNINSWVSDKTFKLVNNLVDDVKDNDFLLINALAINMEWNNKIQSVDPIKAYAVSYQHENYGDYIGALPSIGYHKLSFNDNKINVKSLEIGASINNYDIVKELGRDKIYNDIKEEYTKYLEGLDKNSWEYKNAEEQDELDPDKYTEKFIKELDTGYNTNKSSTDFMLHVDNDVKVFAKDLQKSGNTTLQYVGIMPKKDKLVDYVKQNDAKSINILLQKLKTIDNKNFEQGKIYKVTGFIPVFKYEYDLNLMEDLNKLDIKDIFDKEKSDLSNLTTNKGEYINKAVHKANIEFSNDGIKAAAATSFGGLGALRMGFEHLYEVPVEIIDMTFDKPYMYIIRDKNSGEVWFAGTVYEPTKY